MASKLVRTIALLYRMESDDIRQLADDLTDARVKAWQQGIQEEARRFGYNVNPPPPDGGDLRDLRNASLEEARQIANTWNRDVERQIQKLYDANPRGNRNYYFSNLERWSTDRARWKNAQIALNTAQSARDSAKREFWRRNNLIRNSMYIFTGPPPVCEECTRLFAHGLFTYRETLRVKIPVHVGCPHEFELFTRGFVPQSKLWIG